MRTPVRPDYPAPTIQLAQRDDIPELVRVWFDAESTSVISFLRYPTKEAKSKFRKQVIKQLEDHWDTPHLLIVKAVDADTKLITAVGIWQERGFSQPNTTSDSVFAAAGMLLSSNRCQKTNSQPWTSSPITEVSEELPGEALARHVEAKFKEFLNSWSRNTKNLYLELLMTDPRFQRRGIGTAMLRWGHQRADEEGIPAFLIASPVGHHLYQEMDYKDVETPLHLDLSQWVDGAQGGDRGWGVYKYYYMVRLPKTAAK